MFLKDMVMTMAHKSELFLAEFEKDIQGTKTANMLFMAQMFTSDAILAIVFGEEWDQTQVHPAWACVNETSQLFGKLLCDPLTRLFGFMSMWQLQRCGKLADAEMLVILERSLACGSGGARDKATGPPRDILSLATADISKDGPLTEQDKMAIVDQLKTFCFAGACSLNETTSLHAFPAQFLTVS